MNFYQSIADYYEQIFPLNKMQIDFVRKAINDSEKKSLLDIGCGTGSLSIELSKVFKKATAIDLDISMIEKALEKEHPKVNFRVMNMLDIEQVFGQHSFAAIICFGNTVVHLNSMESILDFFIQSRSVLKENGKLLFQLINYDNIINNSINGLPTIENDAIKFVRNYTYHPEKNMIDFETKLTIKKSKQQIENTIQLYPLRKAEIEDLLLQACFSDWKFYGNFKRDELNENSIPLVVEVVK